MTRNLAYTFIAVHWTAMSLTWSISSFHFKLLILLCLHLTHFKKYVFLNSFLHWSDGLLNFSKIHRWFTEAYPVFQHFFYSISSKNLYSIGRVVVLIRLRNYSIVNFCSQAEFLYPASTEILYHNPRNN